MELFIVLIWILSAFAIPLILIVISGFNYARQGSIVKIIFKFFVALFIYIPFTIFAVFFFGGFLNAVVHRKIPTFWELTLCFVIDFVYALVGWLLCSFVNDSLLKPWLIFSRKYNEPQSIFEK